MGRNGRVVGRSHGRRAPRPVLHAPAVRGARRRTTVLPAAAIAVAAATGPAIWLVVCFAVLLLAHPLVTDARTVGVTAPPGRRGRHPRRRRRLDRSGADRRPGTGRGRLMGASAGASLAIAATTMCLVPALRTAATRLIHRRVV
ncbi:hypothetical protein [Streptomyces misionensis]|uniref:hypothetical protein n=1 Tax=Streptomyces misionensis TaxID=67331 RepID=UPI0036B0A67F